MTVSTAASDLADELGEIADLNRWACVDRWHKAFKTRPPKHLSVRFMQCVLANDLQCRKLGGHTRATRRSLRGVLQQGGTTRPLAVVRDGAVLVREWNGRTYRVEARGDGYVLDEKSYNSLSAVAMHITGAKWSGPRFFGLTPKRSS